MTKRRLIGITGQGGSYLAELLLANGNEVHEISRPASSVTSRMNRLHTVEDMWWMLQADQPDALTHAGQPWIDTVQLHCLQTPSCRGEAIQ